jgi:hypothetical protein
VIAALTLASIAGVCLIVNLFVGDEKLPHGLEGSTPWFGAATGFFFALTVVVHYLVVVRVRLLADQDVLRFSFGPGRDVAVSSFMVGWHRTYVHTGRGAAIPTSTLELAVVDEAGECHALLREELGAAYTPPAGWKECPLGVTPRSILRAAMGRVRLDELAETLRRRGAKRL